VRRVYVGFGSNSGEIEGGLERVTKSHLSGSGKLFYEKYIVMGSKSTVTADYIELPWRGGSATTRLRSLITLFYYSVIFKNCKFFIHGSPILSAFCIPSIGRGIVMHHGDVASEYGDYSLKNFWKLHIIKILTRLQNISYRTHVTYNFDIATQLSCIGRIPYIFPNFVESGFAAKLDHINTNSHPVIISVAFWTKRKNLSKLLEFLNDYKLTRPLVIRIVGRVHTSYQNEFKSTLSQICDLKGVTVERYEGIDDTQLIFLLSTSDFFFHYSIKEGFPRAMQEAQVCGCRIVCSKRFFNADLLGEGAVDFDDLLNNQLKLTPLDSVTRKQNSTRFSDSYCETNYYEKLSKL